MVTAIAVVAGASGMAASLFALVGLIGGIGVAIPPRLAIGAALVGIGIGALDAAIPPLRPDSVRSLEDGIWLVLKVAGVFGLLVPAGLAMNEKL